VKRSKDAQILKHAGTPQEVLRAFQQAVVQRTPETTVRILTPGGPLLMTK